MAVADDRVELIQTIRGSGSMYRRSRSGILLLSAFCCIVLTILFYLCSLDYQTLAVEKKLLRYHEALIKNQIQEDLEQQLLQEELERNHSLDQRHKHFVSPDQDHDNRNSPAPVPVKDKVQTLNSAESDYEARVKEMFDHENAVSSFDIRKKDVIVFLQIQNSGSSLLEHKIIKDLILEKPCSCVKRRCPCLRPAVAQSDDENDEDKDEVEKHDSYWLFSRLTVGWTCGFHADWSELSYCVDPALDQIEGKSEKRRYFFMTQLRDPVKRFLSEYYRWTRSPAVSGSNAVHSCRGKGITVTDQCNMTHTTTMQEWISCPFNLALNRQTRMLADLSLVDCYNYSSMSRNDRNMILLSSAKANLHKMAFFAMAEYPKVSMKLFEYTFGLKFQPSLMEQIVDLKWSNKKIRGQAGRELPDELVELIREANKLDIELYDYAKSLLFDRFNQMESKRHGQSVTAGKILPAVKDQTRTSDGTIKKKPSDGKAADESSEEDDDDNDADEEEETPFDQSR